MLQFLMLMQVKSRRRTIILAFLGSIAFVVAILIVLIFWSASTQKKTTSEQFNEIKATMASLHLDQLGQVAVSKESGANGFLNSNPALVTSVVVIRGDAETVRDELDGSMRAAGFQSARISPQRALRRGPITYSRPGYIASVLIYSAGSTIRAGDQRDPYFTLIVPRQFTGAVVSLGFTS